MTDYSRQKAEAILMLGPPFGCRGCGWTDSRVLEIDHIYGLDPDDDFDSRGGRLSAVRRVLSISADEAKKLFQPLCPRCHRYKTLGLAPNLNGQDASIRKLLSDKWNARAGRRQLEMEKALAAANALKAPGEE